MHGWSRHKEGAWEKARVQSWEVGMVEEERRGRPNSGMTRRLLFHLHRQSHTCGYVMKVHSSELNHPSQMFWRLGGNIVWWEGEMDVVEVNCLLIASLSSLLFLLLVWKFTFLGTHFERYCFGPVFYILCYEPRAEHWKES